MAAISKHIQLHKQWLTSLSKDERWCILIAADPDALGAAMALKRIMSYRVQEVVIASIYKITRPDNLAMVRYLRIPLVSWDAKMQEKFQRFAIVDSQPHHNPAFENIPFSVIIDHHPTLAEHQYMPDFLDIRPEFGATCTMMVQYLQALSIRPGRLLSTALLYGIRTDTAAFERSGDEKDLKAYQWLSKHADMTILRRILRSEYLMAWLPLFSRAFRSLRTCLSKGAHAHVGEVMSPDLLVAIADFFTRVHGLRWVAVSGIYAATIVVIFRGDGSRSMGDFASRCFGDIGSAGGHKAMARAEVPLSAVHDIKANDFVYNRLKTKHRSKKNTSTHELQAIVE